MAAHPEPIESVTEAPTVHQLDAAEFEGRFVPRFERLVKRARKLGVPEPLFEIVERAHETRKRDVGGRKVEYQVEVVRFTVSSESVRVPGFQFLAKIEPAGEDADGNRLNLVVRAPDAPEFDARPFITHDFRCDHCRTRRYRKDVFVLLEEATGALKVVGRNCLADYFGRSPEALVAWAKIWHSLLDASDPDEGFSGGGGRYEESYSFESILALAHRIVLQDGGYISRKGAEISDDLSSTASKVSRVLNPPRGSDRWAREERAWCRETLDAIDAQDEQFAKDGVAWAAALENPSNDYLANLQTLAAVNRVSARRVGLAASLVVAWKKELQRRIERAERPVSQHVGEVKKREVFTLSPVFTTGWETDYGYYHLIKLVDAAGNLFVLKTGSVPEITVERGGQTLCLQLTEQIGNWFEVKATVKAHDEYKGEAQTVIQRAVIVRAIDRTEEVAK